MKRLALLALVAALLGGCGSGGGSTGNTTDTGSGTGVQLQTGPNPAIVAIGTRAPSPTTVLYGAEFKLLLPAGVTMTANADGALADGVLQLADKRAMTGARYVSATSTTRGFLQVNIIDAGGFTVGALATVNCAVSQGAAVGAASFALDGFSARDANGAAITGITPYLEFRTD